MYRTKHRNWLSKSATGRARSGFTSVWSCPGPAGTSSAVGREPGASHRACPACPPAHPCRWPGIFPCLGSDRSACRSTLPPLRRSAQVSTKLQNNALWLHSPPLPHPPPPLPHSPPPTKLPHPARSPSPWPRNSALTLDTYTDRLVQCIFHNIDCAQCKRSLHSRWTLISHFTDERWPTEVTSNAYFRCVRCVRVCALRGSSPL